jgi:hypothetical protein
LVWCASAIPLRRTSTCSRSSPASHCAAPSSCSRSWRAGTRQGLGAHGAAPSTSARPFHRLFFSGIHWPDLHECRHDATRCDVKQTSGKGIGIRFRIRTYGIAVDCLLSCRVLLRLFSSPPSREIGRADFYLEFRFGACFVWSPAFGDREAAGARQRAVRLVIDDTLFRCSGRRVFGAAWQHDPLGWAAARSPEPTPG